MAVIGYARVSTTDQDLSVQEFGSYCRHTVLLGMHWIRRAASEL